MDLPATYQTIKEKIPAILLAGITLVAFLFFQWDNFPGSASLYLGILFFPYLAIRNGSVTARLAVPAIAALVLLFFVKSSTLYYFACALAFLYFIEISWGKLNPLSFLLLAVIAPIFRYIVYIWSFPIRLKMSALVAWSLKMVGMDVSAIGNTILVKGMVYEIEPACMGIKMTGTALVCCLLILAHLVRERKIKLSWLTAILALFTGFMLTLLANYVRLIGLVAFNIGPDHILHHLMGLFSLGVYVILPFYLLCRWRLKPGDELLKKRSVAVISKRNSNWYRRSLGAGALLVVLIIFNGSQFVSEKELTAESGHPWSTLQGYDKSTEVFGVSKLYRQDRVIYIKPPAGPFQGAHDPRICWQGSGFVFNKIKKETIKGLKVYTAEITRDSLTLKTAWWYDDGANNQTTEEWSWRWRSLLHQERYYLVNVSVPEGVDLKRAVIEVNQR